MPNRIVRLPLPPPTADEYRRAEDERQKRLFAWADQVLADLGLADKVRQANTLDELRRVTFDDAEASAVDLAIQAALHPATGRKHTYFVGMNEAMLKRLLKSRFRDPLKKDREAELRSGRTGASGTQTTYDWTSDLKLDDKGGALPILSNLILFLRHHPKWAGVLGFDEFGARVLIRKPPPWGAEVPDAHWTDHHESLTRVWFQQEDIKPGLGDLGRAVQAAARDNSFNPVREYLDSAVWDGTPRLDTCFTTYWKADDTPYIRAIAPRFMISAVARIYKPGCKVDHMPVFEGPQGQGKTETLRALAVKESWFSDRLSHMATKDAAIETAGVWLFELAEMDALTRASSSTAKAFIPRRHDRYRPPHGKHTISHARQCIFAGTINPPVGGYLKDTTGARRFWPVACHGMIDRDGIERDRNQLWAEAIVRFKAGAPWWLETAELEALATAEQALRFKVDAWH
jgi:putative DNA primase/helicase